MHLRFYLQDFPHVGILSDGYKDLTLETPSVLNEQKCFVFLNQYVIAERKEWLRDEVIMMEWLIVIVDGWINVQMDGVIDSDLVMDGVSDGQLDGVADWWRDW